MAEGFESTDSLATIPNEQITIPQKGRLLEIPPELYDKTILNAGDSIEIDGDSAIYSQATMISKTGVNIGELVAVMQLPFKDTRVPAAMPKEELDERIDALKVYCFRDYTSDQAHSLPSYVMIGEPQLRQMEQGIDVPRESLLTLDTIGEEKAFGRESWMPDVGPNIPDVADTARYEPFYEQNNTVSREHGSFAMGDRGQLIVQIDDSVVRNETYVLQGEKGSINTGDTPHQ